MTSAQKIVVDLLKAKARWVTVVTSDQRTFDWVLQQVNPLYPSVKWRSGKRPTDKKFLPRWSSLNFEYLGRHEFRITGSSLPGRVLSRTAVNPVDAVKAIKMITLTPMDELQGLAEGTARQTHANREGRGEIGPHRCPICGGTGTMGFTSFYHDDPNSPCGK